ncbi:MAG: hypothetical protein M1818_001317 [Claussenomyces sp. TS43310]|nr:MAG: hypothetical protein M1818_001317 [Claussenomyces sp. TS43310]
MTSLEALISAPLQVYWSAPVFALENDIIQKQFEKDIPSWTQVKPKVQAIWNTALQTLEGHSGPVSSSAVSPDGKLVVSGLWDETIRLWDIVISTASQTLRGHSGVVRSVAFSPDGRHIIFHATDGKVRLWDIGMVL